MNNMLTADEVKNFLGVDQPSFDRFLKDGKLHAYKIGGTYLRFRKEDVLTLRAQISPKKNLSAGISLASRLGDFWRFNNFYIVSILIAAVVIWVVVRFY